MSVISKRCIEYDEVRALCTASENGKKYILNNRSGLKIRKVKVDGCVPQQIGNKICDYLFTIDDELIRRAIFVELKGGALTHAVKQILSTVIILKRDLNNYRLDARIIGTKDVPGFINTPDYRRLAREVKLNGTIERATNKILSEII